jgi:hypothetical protein
MALALPGFDRGKWESAAKSQNKSPGEGPTSLRISACVTALVFLFDFFFFGFDGGFLFTAAQAGISNGCDACKQNEYNNKSFHSRKFCTRSYGFKNWRQIIFYIW